MDLGAVSTAVADLYAALAAPAATASVGVSRPAGVLEADALLATIEQAQQVVNICGGIQAQAMAHLAAHEEVRDVEDASGWRWKRNCLGFVADDTASLLADRLGVSVPVAAGRVEDAVHQVTVTPRLVDAMGSGALDQFRAHLVTREVKDCDDATAATIVERLVARAAEPAPWKITDASPDRDDTGDDGAEGDMGNRAAGGSDSTSADGEDGAGGDSTRGSDGEPGCPSRGWDETAGPLASRTRRLVTRHAPDVAAARKKQAVKDRCLTRRAISEAADQWHGLVPVEQSLVMWQAVDHLARTLQNADPALTLDQARVDALQQLVLQQADVTIHLHATHPAAAADPTSRQTTPDAPATMKPGQSATAPSPARAATARESARAATASDPAGSASAAHATRSAARTSTAESMASRGGTTAAPADCHPAAESASASTEEPAAPAPGRRTGLAERAVRGVVELGGLNRPGTTIVDLDRLPASVHLTDSTTLTCHPDTGALLSGHVPKSLAPTARQTPPTTSDSTEERYRPSPALQRLTRLRDGHCRFPGCRVPACSCDLDHVIAWPTGPTTATNLICLCRRHHRVKQRPGWTVRLDPDGIVHWTDPAGRHTSTAPVDHLDRVLHQRSFGLAKSLDTDHAASNLGASKNDREAEAATPSTDLTRGPESTGTPRTRRDRSPAPHASTSPLTRASLADLLATTTAAPHSLAELALARLLDLASPPHIPDQHNLDEGATVERSSEPPTQTAALAVECQFGPWNVTVDIPTIDPRPSQPEPSPPPF